MSRNLIVGRIPAENLAGRGHPLPAIVDVRKL